MIGYHSDHGSSGQQPEHGYRWASDNPNSLNNHSENKYATQAPTARTKQHGEDALSHREQLTDVEANTSLDTDPISSDCGASQSAYQDLIDQFLEVVNNAPNTNFLRQQDDRIRQPNISP